MRPITLVRTLVSDPPLKAFRVTYPGLYIGGNAVVLARDEEEAKELVKADSRTLGWLTRNIVVTEVGNVLTPAVLYNNNGDY